MNVLFNKEVKTTKKTVLNMTCLEIGDTIELIGSSDRGEFVDFSGELMVNNGYTWVAVSGHKILTGTFGTDSNYVTLVNESHVSMSKLGIVDRYGLSYELRSEGKKINPRILGYETISEEQVTEIIKEVMKVNSLIDLPGGNKVNVIKILKRTSGITGENYLVIVVSDDLDVYSGICYRTSKSIVFEACGNIPSFQIDIEVQ